LPSIVVKQELSKDFAPIAKITKFINRMARKPTATFGQGSYQIFHSKNFFQMLIFVSSRPSTFETAPKNSL
jgi:hypothetical protein